MFLLRQDPYTPLLLSVWGARIVAGSLRALLATQGDPLSERAVGGGLIFDRRSRCVRYSFVGRATRRGAAHGMNSLALPWMLPVFPCRRCWR